MGDTIKVHGYGKSFDIDVIDIKPENPSNCICLIDCDIELDFAPPHDYVEPKKSSPKRKIIKKVKVFIHPFMGKGIRFDNRKLTKK